MEANESKHAYAMRAAKGKETRIVNEYMMAELWTAGDNDVAGNTTVGAFVAELALSRRIALPEIVQYQSRTYVLWLTAQISVWGAQARTFVAHARGCEAVYRECRSGPYVIVNASWTERVRSELRAAIDGGMERTQ